MHASLLHRSKLQLGLTITGKNQLHISHDELVKREKEGDSIFRRLHPAAYTVQKSVHTGTVYCIRICLEIPHLKLVKISSGMHVTKGNYTFS